MIETKNKGWQELKSYIPQNKQQEFEQKWEKITAELEEQAFMEGYCYAIKILEDSIVNQDYKNH